MYIFAFTMQKAGTWKPISGIGDIIAWLMVSLMGLALFKIPFLGFMAGWHFPTHATDTQQAIAGAASCALWFALMYWRIPGRMLDYLRKGRQ